ncbi:MAG TPA: Fe-S cluster assembly protein SufB, partial [Gemmatimonadota bacterium]|nr:Fe-S cluster assembly protein SufB [Gemmatimonadota bacterium]
MPIDTNVTALNLDDYKYGFKDPDNYVFKSEKGLSKKVVEMISSMKEEPEWMLKFRLKALEIYEKKPVPTWGADLSGLNMDEIYFYVKPSEKEGRSWEDVPEDIKRTFDRLGIPEAERKSLAGVGAQYESEMVYHKIKDELADQGVIFDSIEDGLKNHPDLFRQYFATVIPPHDNKYAALNSAVWSGGSFIYVPKGVEVDIPLQAYFRVNSENLGQFERTLIIADEGAKLHYIEGCTAPTYSTDSFHSGVIEIIVNKGANVRYTTIQNWSNNMYNLVTQRARVAEDARMAWLDGNLGSKVTMKYPSCYLMEPGASGEIMSIAYAGPGQHQDAGGKMVHAAPHTTSEIVSKSISKG